MTQVAALDAGQERAASDSPDSRLIVIAGPGAGKSEVVGERCRRRRHKCARRLLFRRRRLASAAGDQSEEREERAAANHGNPPETLRINGNYRPSLRATPLKRLTTSRKVRGGMGHNAGPVRGRRRV